MTDRAFLAAICAAPDDDAPRLQYADWLDENGQPERAAFVRRQVYGQEPDRSLGYEAIEYRTAGGGTESLKGLLRWSDGLPPEWLKRECKEFPPVSRVYRRGFVGSVSCTAADWLQYADAILAEHPVTEVRLTTPLEWPRAQSLAFKRIDAGRLQALDVPWIASIEAEGPERWAKDLWPTVRTWHLPEPLQVRRLFSHVLVPNEILADNARWVVPIESSEEWTQEDHDRAIRALAGDSTVPLPMGVISVDDPDASPSLAPPDNARRRPGHSRMPSWLSEARGRPGRRPR